MQDSNLKPGSGPVGGRAGITVTVSSQTEPGDEGSLGHSSAAELLATVWEYIWTLGLMALLVFSCRSSLADWYEVPSGSMLPTIQLGDRIFVNKLAYDLRMPFSGTYVPFTDYRIPYVKLASLGTPSRGDIVVFVWPEDNRTDYVKRLVGLPGDRVEVRNNILFVNGQEMPREEVDQNKQGVLPPGAATDPNASLFVENLDGVKHLVFESVSDNFGPTIVPDHMYFMMGDNRDNSSDSRSWGFVPAENLRGKALRVVLSFDPSPQYSFGNPQRVRWSRMLLSLLP